MFMTRVYLMKPKQRNDNVFRENCLKVLLLLKPYHKERTDTAQECGIKLTKLALSEPYLMSVY